MNKSAKTNLFFKLSKESNLYTILNTFILADSNDLNKAKNRQLLRLKDDYNSELHKFDNYFFEAVTSVKNDKPSLEILFYFEQKNWNQLKKNFLNSDNSYNKNKTNAYYIKLLKLLYQKNKQYQLRIKLAHFIISNPQLKKLYDKSIYHSQFIFLTNDVQSKLLIPSNISLDNKIIRIRSILIPELLKYLEVNNSYLQLKDLYLKPNLFLNFIFNSPMYKDLFETSKNHQALYHSIIKLAITLIIKKNNKLGSVKEIFTVNTEEIELDLNEMLNLKIINLEYGQKYTYRL